MHGIKAGIDRDATLQLLRSKRIDNLEKEVLRSIVSGALITQHRLFKAGLSATGVCPFCDSGQEETAEHVWWQCSAWTSVRQKFFCNDCCPSLWPPCFRQCALMPALGVLGQEAVSLDSPDGERQAAACEAFGDTWQDLPLEKFVNGRV
eukprot:11279375-Karenia_brevis.AAC.1